MSTKPFTSPTQTALIRGAGSTSGPTRSPLARMLSGSGGALIGLIVLFTIFAVTTPRFFSANNLINVVDQVTVIGVLAIGATAVIITGGIDLSVGSVLALSTMVLGWLSDEGGVPMGVAMVAAVAVGALAGLLNGLGVTVAGLPPFIATLAMMSICRGLANLVTDGQQIVGYPEWFYSLASNRYLGFFSVTAIVFILLAIAATVILRYRPAGRKIYAIGGSAEVARLAGIKVRSVTTWVYVTAGALAGVGAIILASRLDSSQPSAGTGYELDVIAAVVIGGASLSGGTGRISGTVIGVLIIGVLRNGLNLLGVSPFLQQIVIGLVIAGAVIVDVLRRRRTH
ncbi:ABC transporter permease [Microbacterium sp. SA39]|uniref:ABC transporter permease n=1 Tax=Microbacterium sp. SA39 TaxID=1263625 RepID=UPI0005F9C70B|nr:ABC transporter permease [Microbacterium sp. SA39]KJQ52883.1 Ribose transport system permease protein RbsC [Microbacterium sp. SA39]